MIVENGVITVIITDPWGRTIEFVASNKKYSRTVTDAPTPTTKTPVTHSISRSTFALALLTELEDKITGPTPQTAPLVTPDSDPEPDELDKWLGPRKRR